MSDWTCPKKISPFGHGEVRRGGEGESMCSVVGCALSLTKLGGADDKFGDFFVCTLRQFVLRKLTQSIHKNKIQQT